MHRGSRDAAAGSGGDSRPLLQDPGRIDRSSKSHRRHRQEQNASSSAAGHKSKRHQRAAAIQRSSNRRCLRCLVAFWRLLRQAFWWLVDAVTLWSLQQTGDDSASVDSPTAPQQNADNCVTGHLEKEQRRHLFPS